MSAEKTLWELLWDYDPNGLIVVDAQRNVKVVNPAFCRMFKVKAEDVLGKPASLVLGDLDSLEQVWNTDEVVRGREQEYPHLDLYVRQVSFSVRSEQIAACIMVDLTSERRHRDELRQLRLTTVERATQVVEKQMKVAQEIASLLGETTAETKVSLQKLIETVEREES